MTHSYERHDSFILETWLIHMRDMTHHMRDMTHSYERHDSFIWETWLIHMRNMTHSYERHDSSIYFPRRDSFIYVLWDMTHSYMYSGMFTTGLKNKSRCDSSIQSFADRVAKLLRLFWIFFNLVPGVPGFSWDLSLVPCNHIVLIVKSVRILVRLVLNWKI